MPKYSIYVSYTARITETIEVEAGSEIAAGYIAKERAEDKAHSLFHVVEIFDEIEIERIETEEEHDNGN
jgi:hypothetical protein